MGRGILGDFRRATHPMDQQNPTIFGTFVKEEDRIAAIEFIKKSS